MLGLVLNQFPETRVIADPEYRAAATFFSMINIGALVLAILASRDRSRPRVIERYRTSEPVTYEGDDGEPISASLCDISVGGAGMNWPRGRSVPRTLTLHVPGGRTIRAEVVRNNGDKLGLRFDLADSHERDAVLLWVYSIGLSRLPASLSMTHLSRRLVARFLGSADG